MRDGGIWPIAEQRSPRRFRLPQFCPSKDSLFSPLLDCRTMNRYAPATAKPAPEMGGEVITKSKWRGGNKRGDKMAADIAGINDERIKMVR